MLQQLRAVGRTLLFKLGVDVRLIRSTERQRAMELHERIVGPWRTLQRYGFKTVLDIGANVGHFAKLMVELVPNCHILSFEPLADCYPLVADYLRSQNRGEAFCCALGDVPGMTTIHRYDFAPSSSLLPITKLHTSEAPKTAITRPEEIRVERLDDLLADRVLPGPVLAKIDVQGFEDSVIRGGGRVLAGCDVVVVECSTYVFYEGQPLFPTILQMMQQLGFVYRGNLDQWTSTKDGRILQFDALFEHSRLETCGKTMSVV